MSTSNRYRLSLKSLLLTALYLLVGLAATTRPPHLAPAHLYTTSTGWLWIVFDCSLATVGCALILGLFQQLRTLRDCAAQGEYSAGKMSSAIRWAGFWRILLILLLAGCLAFRLAVAQGLVIHPYDWNEDFYLGIGTPVIPDALLYLGIFAALNLNESPSQRRLNPKSRRYMQLVWIGFGTAIVFVALCNLNLIVYLVYLAIAGIEHYQPARFYRPGAYAIMEADRERFVWNAVLGCSSLVVGLILWLMAIEHKGRMIIRTILILSGSIGLLISAGYSYWYFRHGFPVLAPELQVLQSDWWNWLEATTVTAIAIPFIAYKASRISNGVQTEAGVQLKFPIGIGMLVCGLLGAMSGLAYLVDQWFLRDYVYDSFVNKLKSFVTELSVYLPVAIFLLYLQFVWQCVISKKGLPNPTVPTIDPHRFAVVCLALLLILSVAIPTLAASSFTVWLSRWMS